MEPARGDVIRWTLAVCCLSLALGAAAADDDSRLRALKQEIGADERRVARTAAERRAMERKLQDAEAELAALRKREARLVAEVDSAKRQLQQLDARRSRVETTRQRQLQRLADDVAVAYRLGRSEPFKALLNQEDPHAAARMMQYYGYFAAARAEQLAGYRDAVAELDALEAEAAAERTRVQARQEQLEQERAQLAASLDKRRTLVAALAAQLTDERSRLQQKHAEANRLQRLLEELARRKAANEQAARDKAASERAAREKADGEKAARKPADKPVSGGSGAFARQAGQLPWPVAGRLLHRFGASQAGALRWNGWMLAVAEGTPVRAVHAGTVVFADYLRGYGELVIVDHGNGYLTLYAHNQRLLKAAGGAVAGGEAVAHAGNSGGQRDSALYFEIRQGGKPLDPARWLRRQP